MATVSVTINTDTISIYRGQYVVLRGQVVQADGDAEDISGANAVLRFVVRSAAPAGSVVADTAGNNPLVIVKTIGAGITKVVGTSVAGDTGLFDLQIDSADTNAEEATTGARYEWELDYGPHAAPTQRRPIGRGTFVLLPDLVRA